MCCARPGAGQHPGRFSAAGVPRRAGSSAGGERRGDALEAWITEAAASGLEALARFAQGLRDDLAAVKAGRTLPWSNGPVEGHVNRLKMLKRQGYGRAGVGLLRQRVMQVV